MLQRIYDFLSAAIPKPSDTILMSIGGSLGALATFAFGTIDNAVVWLFAFIVTDYATGTVASFKSGKWCSSVGFTGLFKKFFMLCVVAMCHGLDETAGCEFLRNVAIFAYSLNEVGSIIENIERLGMGYLIPGVIRRGLQQLREKEDDLFTEGTREYEREINNH